MTRTAHLPLYERDAELALLDEALTAAVAGAGRVLLIQGAPGIGKTRLLQALCERARPRATVLRGRGGEQERELALGVVRELFEPVALRTPAEERADLFAGPAGLALPLLGGHAAPVPATDTAFAMMHGLYWLTANLAERSPVVFAVDDAQWADEATQRWLAYLMPRLDELPVLLAMTVRPREISPESRLAAALSALPEVTVVEPAPLSEQATGQVLGDLAGEADAQFRAAVQTATDGNPLLVRTLAAALASDGVPPVAANAGRVDAVGAGGIARIVLPRLHGLGPHAVDLARAAAVLGENAWLHDAIDLSGADLATGQAAAAALVRADVLRPGATAFTHPLVRATVLGELDEGARAEFNRRAADLLFAHGASAETTAAHLLAAPPAEQPWALTTLRDAARVALDRGAPQIAVTFLDRALREGLEPRQRADLLFELGAVGFKARDARAIDWLHSAVADAQDRAQWVRAAIAEMASGALMGARPSPDAILQAAPDLDGDLAFAVSAALLADYGYTSASGGPRYEQLVRPGQDPPGRTSAERTWLATTAFRAVMECVSAQRATALAERAMTSGTLLAESADDWAFVYAATALLFGSGPARAIEEYDRGVEDAVRRGSMTAYERFCAHRARAYLHAGSLADAEADLLASLEAQSDVGWNLGTPAKFALLADICRERGELDRAEEALAARGLLAAEPPPTLHGAYLLDSRGRLRLARGLLAEALADFEACRRYLEGFGCPRSAAFSWRSSAALCHRALGSGEEAEHLASEQLADARSFGDPRWLGMSLRVAGMVREGPAGIELLREAVAVLEPSEARLEHAHALCDHGVLLRHNRQPRDAREPLRQALDLADRCGAHALAERATQELLAAGGRPRRRVLTGAASLTPAEQRVARLAADGLSNPEIAQSLFVTRKTVETQLGAVYRKLGITTRAELAGALTAAP